MRVPITTALWRRRRVVVSDPDACPRCSRVHDLAPADCPNVPATDSPKDPRRELR